MNPKPVIIAGIVAVLFVATVYFGGPLIIKQRRVEELNRPTGAKTKRLVGKSAEPTASEPTKPSVNTPTTNDEQETSGTQHPTLEKRFSTSDTAVSTSSNPMFASGVPAHLQCPEEWIDVYGSEFKGDRHELGRISQPRIDEILSKYNPHRALTEVWPLFIEAEKFYYANADPERADPGEGRGRLDWAYQNLLDFPEVFVLGNVDTERRSVMRQVAIGNWDADWNLHRLPDGRELRAQTGYAYEVILDQLSENSKGQTRYNSVTLGFGHSGRDTNLITINLSETSDEELEQLGGWNYNIDPYATGIYRLSKDATERVLEMNRNAYGGFKK